MTQTDWTAWSREAVTLMQSRNAEWPERYGVAGAPYRWDLSSGTLRFTRPAGDVVASLRLVGTVCESQGTFLWSWADPQVPEAARAGIEAVRQFGAQHDLDLLETAEVTGGHSQALELLAIAGRILQAEGVFIDRMADMTLYFTIGGFRADDGAKAGC